MKTRPDRPRLQINARLVKEKDRARAGELRRLLVYGAVVVVPLLVCVWERVEFLRISYRVEELKKDRQDLLETNKELTVERSLLLSPDRIEKLARHQLGLSDPSPEDVRRVVVIDGHVNEVSGQVAEAAERHRESGRFVAAVAAAAVRPPGERR